MFYGDSSDYLHLLPDDWRELLEIKVISNGVNIQLDKVLDRIKACVTNKSVTLADESGVCLLYTSPSPRDRG